MLSPVGDITIDLTVLGLHVRKGSWNDLGKVMEKCLLLQVNIVPVKD